MTSSVCCECVMAGAEVAVVSSRKSLLSVWWKGMRISLRACWGRATVQLLIEVVELRDGAGSLRLAALWPRVDHREDGWSEA